MNLESYGTSMKIKSENFPYHPKSPLLCLFAEEHQVHPLYQAVTNLLLGTVIELYFAPCILHKQNYVLCIILLMPYFPV